jgi:hypothetical protein
VSVAIIVTCKGRLAHLQQTAPLLLTHPRVLSGEVGYLLVDWGCPEGSGAWLKARYPHANVLRTEAQGFEKTRANNLGAAAAARAGYTHLLFLDADTLVHPVALDWLVSHAAPGLFTFVKPKDPRGEIRVSLTGILLVPTSDFLRVGGYDTTFGATYGNEDVELRLHLWIMGGMGFDLIPEPLVEGGAIQAIPHSDELRMTYYGGASALDQNVVQTLEHLCRRYASYTGGRRLGYDQHQGPHSETLNKLMGTA